MKKTAPWILFPLVLALFLLSCASGGRPERNESSGLPLERAVLGTWISTEAMMLEETTLHDDGMERSVIRMFGPAGEFEIKVEARWKIEEGRFSSEITESSFPEILPVGDTLKYDILSLSDRKLVFLAEDGEEIYHYRKLTPEHRRLVESFLETSGTRIALEQAWRSIRDAQMKQIEAMSLPEDKQEVAERIMGAVSDYLGKAMAYDKVKHYYSYLYADLFSKEELRQLIKFYESGVGRKLIYAMPEAMDRSMKDGMKKMQLLTPAINQIIQDILEGMEKSPRTPEGA